MRRSLESLDDPRQVIDPIRKDEFSLRAIVSGIVDAARNAGDELRGEAKDLESPQRSVERGGQEFSGVGGSAALQTDRVMSQVDTALPIIEQRETDNVLSSFGEGKSSCENVNRKAEDPDLNAPKPDFDSIKAGMAGTIGDIEEDRDNYPRD